jgi:hypothetical protein
MRATRQPAWRRRAHFFIVDPSAGNSLPTRHLRSWLSFSRTTMTTADKITVVRILM